MKVKTKFDIMADDPNNYSGEMIPANTVLTLFTGATYGVIGYEGQAFTFSNNPAEGPFFELPRNYVSGGINE